MAAMAAENRLDAKESDFEHRVGRVPFPDYEPASIAAAAAMAPRITGDDQERFGASMIPHSSKPRPTMESPAPIGSERLALTFFELGTSQIAANSPISAIGTLMRNTDPHQKWASSQPPATGPTATPSPVVPDQIPMAWARARASVKVLVRIDSVGGHDGRSADPHEGPCRNEPVGGSRESGRR